jgi:hypothetical protein
MYEVPSIINMINNHIMSGMVYLRVLFDLKTMGGTTARITTPLLNLITMVTNSPLSGTLSIGCF